MRSFASVSIDRTRAMMMMGMCMFCMTFFHNALSIIA